MSALVQRYRMMDGYHCPSHTGDAHARHYSLIAGYLAEDSAINFALQRAITAKLLAAARSLPRFPAIHAISASASDVAAVTESP